MDFSATQFDACLQDLESLLARPDSASGFYGHWAVGLLNGLPLSAIEVSHVTAPTDEVRHTASAGNADELAGLSTSDVLARSLQCLRRSPDIPVYVAAGAHWSETGFVNASPSSVFVLALRRGHEVAGMIHVAMSGKVSTETRRLCQEALLAAVAIAESFEETEAIRRHTQEGDWWQSLDAFVNETLAARGSQALAATIANGGADLLECRSVTVVEVSRSNSRVLATTGVDCINHAGELARRAGQLGSRVARYGEAVSQDSEDLPPDLERVWADYLDLTSARHLAAFPVPDVADAEVMYSGWILIVESATGDGWKRHERRAQQFLRYVRQALRTTRYYESLPFFSVARCLGKIQGTVRTPRAMRWGLVALLLAVATVAAAMFPVPMSIQARGTIQPSQRRHIFAPADGVITGVSVRQGDAVASDEIVLTLRRHEIQQQVTHLAGQLETLKAELQSVRTLQLHRSGTDRGTTSQDPSIRIRQLETAIISVTSQLKTAREEADTMAVRAPFAGTILSRAPTTQLLGRPVSKGQVLLSLAALENSWELELDIGEHEVRHVVAAQQEEPVIAEFLCVADLDRRYPATLRVLEQSAVVEEGQEPMVRAVLDVSTKPAKVPPGTRVVADLHCGNRALGYVLFRRLIDAISYAWLF